VGQKQIGGLIRAGARAGAVLAVLALTSVPAAAGVQDTMRVDTVRADSLVAEQDSLLPPPVLVAWPRTETEPGGLVDGRWVWDEEALLNEGTVSLLDLLSRVPGLVTLRSGVFLQPESVSTFGGGADRVVVIWDGYVLDPLESRSLDLSTIQLAHIERVEVDRRPDVLVIRLYSTAPTDARAYSRIEAGVGEPDANLFRGLLLVPHVAFGPFGFGAERVELRGSGRPQPADVFAGWVRWGLLSERRGIEFTLRNTSLSREPESPVPADISRRDLVVRGRTKIGSVGVGEAYFGQSTADYAETNPLIDDSLQISRTVSAQQAGARVALETERAFAEGAVRWRNEERLPRLDIELAGRIRPVDGLQIEAGIANQKWDSGFGATSYHASASFRPLPWIRAFGAVADGRRGSPSEIDSITTPHKSNRRVLRGGLEASLGRFTGAFAGVRVTADSVPLAGFPGDSLSTGAVGAGTLNGWEASASVRLIGNWLSMDGAWSAWITDVQRAYTPQSIGRATLRVHTSPLESGNFELLARVDAMYRGPVSGAPGEPGEVPPQASARTVVNAYLQMRIIDVRIWVRFDDMAGNDVEDVPGLFIQGPRIYYGVKWSFWN
jgi:hypothetical protein